MSRIYLDHNATTSLRPEVLELWLELLERVRGNPSSVHRAGREARQVLDEARERVATALGVHEDEIVFTSGGTEANNLAILGTMRKRGSMQRFVTTQAEHSSVLAAAEELASEGFGVARIAVDREGQPALDALRESLADASVGLVSVMAANNEVGTLPPLACLGAALAERGPRGPSLHTDAVQALGRIPIRLREWRADLASFSAHKIGGPLGVGVLYRRKGVALSSLCFGGEQEGGLRPGTENVPAIAAAALAVELAIREQPQFEVRARALCELLWNGVRAFLPDVSIHGPPLGARERLPNTVNLSVPSVDGRTLVARLDLEGLEVSAGSACASGSLEPSHVLLAMGAAPNDARAGLRISIGRTTTEQDIHSAVDILRITLASMR